MKSTAIAMAVQAALVGGFAMVVENEMVEMMKMGVGVLSLLWVMSLMKIPLQ
jgi:hypothetical protein